MEEEELEQVEGFNYVGSCININGITIGEITIRIYEARATSNLRYHWRDTYVSLAAKSRFYNSSFRSTPLYEIQT